MKEPHKLRDEVNELLDDTIGELDRAEQVISFILKAVEDSLEVTTAQDLLDANSPHDVLVYRTSEVIEALKKLKEE